MSESGTVPVTGRQIEGAWLVAGDGADGARARIIQRHREPAAVRESSAGDDGQDHGRFREPIERRGGHDHDRPGPFLFMACGGVEADQPDLAPLHYSSSLPTGRASSQA